MTTSKTPPRKSHEERRAFGRRKTFKRAKIRAPGRDDLPAVIIDISQGGARIELASPVVAPDRFELVIEDDDFIVACELVHRQETSIGVCFVASPRRLSWTPSARAEQAKEFVRRMLDLD